MMCKKKMFGFVGMFTIQVQGLGFQDVEVQSLGVRILMMCKKKMFRFVGMFTIQVQGLGLQDVDI